MPRLQVFNATGKRKGILKKNVWHNDAGLPKWLVVFIISKLTFFRIGHLTKLTRLRQFLQVSAAEFTSVLFWSTIYSTILHITHSNVKCVDFFVYLGRPLQFIFENLRTFCGRTKVLSISASQPNKISYRPFFVLLKTWVISLDNEMTVRCESKRVWRLGSYRTFLFLSSASLLFLLKCMLQSCECYDFLFPRMRVLTSNRWLFSSVLVHRVLILSECLMYVKRLKVGKWGFRLLRSNLPFVRICTPHLHWNIFSF